MQIRETLEAVRELEYQTIILYPNVDVGGREIIEHIREYEHIPFIKVFKSIPQEEYFSLLKVASVIVGNSSSGIIESSSFKLPVVNIGIRQEGRERSSNVLDVRHDRNEIIKAIKTALFDKGFQRQVEKCNNPYGDGRVSERIVNILKTIKLDKNLLEKKLTY